MPLALKAAIAVLLALLSAPAIGSALADDDEAQWRVVETIDVLSHSSRAWTSLYEQGSVNDLGFQAQGGNVRCFSMEFWFADGRRQYIGNRIYEEGVIVQFRIEGANRTIQRIALNCHPAMGVAHMGLSVMVR